MTAPKLTPLHELKLLNTTQACLLTLVIAACGGAERELPAIPDLAYETMSEPVRAQLADALAAVEAAPTDAQANGRLGMLLDAYRKTAAAEVLYSRARQLEPDAFRWSYLHGRTLIQLGEDQAALSALERALALRPGYPAAQLAVGQLQAKSGQTDRALDLYRKLIERNPKYAQAHASLGKLLLELAQPQAALESLLTAVDLSSRYGEAHYLLAQAYRQSGQTELAETHAALFERYRKLGPPLNDALAQEVQRLDLSEAGLLQQALTDHARGRHERAAEHFLAMAQAAPESASPHVNLIAVFGAMERYDRALDHARQAAELDPDSVELHDNLGVLYMKQGRVEQAKSSFRRAMELDPDYALPRKNFAAALLADDDTEQAIAYYRSALELEPTDRHTRYLLGRTLLADGQAAAAAEILQPLARATVNESPTHLHTLGLALLDSGQHAAAVPVLERARRLALIRGLPSAGQMGADLERARAGA